MIRSATVAGQALLEQDNPSLALKLLEQVLREHDHPNLHYLRGQSLERCGQIASARYAFCKAVAGRRETHEVEVTPGACSWGSTTRLGYLAILEGELEAAQANFVTAVKQIGAQPDCITGLIESWLRAGQLEPAVQELEVVLSRQNSASPDEITLQALVAELMGDPAGQATRLTEAVARVGDLREQHRRNLMLDLSCSLALSQGDVELASKLAKSTGGIGAASSVTSSLWGTRLSRDQLADARVQAIAANLVRYQPALARTLSRRIPLRQLAACAQKRGARRR